MIDSLSWRKCPFQLRHHRCSRIMAPCHLASTIRHLAEEWSE